MVCIKQMENFSLSLLFTYNIEASMNAFLFVSFSSTKEGYSCSMSWTNNSLKNTTPYLYLDDEHHIRIKNFCSPVCSSKKKSFFHSKRLFYRLSRRILSSSLLTVCKANIMMSERE